MLPFNLTVALLFSLILITEFPRATMAESAFTVRFPLIRMVPSLNPTKPEALPETPDLTLIRVLLALIITSDFCSAVECVVEFCAKIPYAMPDSELTSMTTESEFNVIKPPLFV